MQPVVAPMATVPPAMPPVSSMAYAPRPAYTPAPMTMPAPVYPSPIRRIDPPRISLPTTPSGPRADVFTDTPARYLGYTSEVTTATRTLPLFASRFTMWNPLGWFITIGYGLGHALNTAKNAQSSALKARKTPQQARQEAGTAFGEKVTFHSVSTWVLPILMIHAVQKITRKAMLHLGKAPRFWPVLSGLAIIPFIPKALDPVGDKVVAATTNRLIKPLTTSA